MNFGAFAAEVCNGEVTVLRFGRVQIGTSPHCGQQMTQEVENAKVDFIVQAFVPQSSDLHLPAFSAE
jgi:hypothetical protein